MSQNHPTDNPTDTTRIAHRPTQEFVDRSNVARFMREFGVEDHEALVDRCCRRHPDRDDAGVDWFWDVLPEYLGVEWYEEYDEVRDDTDGPQFTEWYPGGRLNVAHNCVDRHAADPERRNHPAVVWEGEAGEVRERSYRDLRRESDRVANALDTRGVGEGDTVGVFLPMLPETASVLYGCLKVGAIAVPVFSGFGVDAVASRLDDADCRVLFTADGFLRRGSPVPLKSVADDALDRAGSVEHVIVVERLGRERSVPDPIEVPTPLVEGRDETWTDAVETAPSTYETTSVPADHESLLMYSSGTTGKPKGIVHTHTGLQLQCAKEVHFGFDYGPDDRLFWVSDIGWMMGPWALVGAHTFGGTAVMYEGAPDHPEPDRFWELIERHGVTTFGVSPTAVRALRKAGDEYVERHDLSSLRVLGSTGEPWDADSWAWFYETVGGGRCPIVNISGGTEVAGSFLMPLPTQPLKPCALGGPSLGMAVDVVDADGDSVVDSHERGYLVATDSAPSMTKSLWAGDERYLAEYWSTWEDLWDHGDWARVDEDGFWFLLGRSDDALNVAGRKVGPAEIEGVLVEHDSVNRAAVVGVPDETTGTAVVTYVIPTAEAQAGDDLRAELRAAVGASHGKPFRPREVYFVSDFPRTQSGKVVRRAIAAAYTGEDAGDLSSLSNPEALDAIRDAR